MFSSFVLDSPGITSIITFIHSVDSYSCIFITWTRGGYYSFTIFSSDYWIPIMFPFVTGSSSIIRIKRCPCGCCILCHHQYLLVHYQIENLSQHHPPQSVMFVWLFISPLGDEDFPQRPPQSLLCYSDYHFTAGWIYIVLSVLHPLHVVLWVHCKIKAYPSVLQLGVSHI